MIDQFHHELDPMSVRSLMYIAYAIELARTNKNWPRLVTQLGTDKIKRTRNTIFIKKNYLNVVAWGIKLGT
jgi:hypothetical protein